MKTRTELHLNKGHLQLSHEDAIVLLGSCFSEHIGQMLQMYGFRTMVNPFGTIFNALSLARLIEKSVDNLDVLAEEVEFQPQGEVFFHYDYSSKLYGESQNDLILKINQLHEELKTQLLKAKMVFLTLGTSKVYMKNEKPVANCHKMPNTLFDKRWVSISEQVAALSKVMKSMKGLNSGLQVVLTVSPVRHIKDGIEENSISKALLRCVASDLCDQFDYVSYFPSYEIMMDDLRDYRYYEGDLIHPNEMAIQYIWSQFENRFFNEKTKNTNRQIDRLRKNLNHRPINKQSQAYQNFLQITDQRIKSLKDAYPILIPLITEMTLNNE